MRALQFWILVLGSSFVSILFVREIFLSRDLTDDQRQLVADQETVSQGAAFENAWKQIAIRIYQVGNQDPALMELLKQENVGIHADAAPNAGSAPASAPSAPPTSSQTPIVPVQPAAP
jgi:hypothetical protein